MRANAAMSLYPRWPNMTPKWLIVISTVKDVFFLSCAVGHWLFWEMWLESAYIFVFWGSLKILSDEHRFYF